MTDNTVTNVQPLQSALAVAEEPGDIQKIRTAAQAASMYARKNHMHELALKCKLVELDAARKLGEWIISNVTPGHPNQDDFIGLPEYINKSESHRLRLIAQLPDEKYQEWINDKLAMEQEITMGGIRRMAENWAKKHVDYSNVYTFDSLLAGIEWRLDTAWQAYPDRRDEIIAAFLCVVGGEWQKGEE